MQNRITCVACFNKESNNLIEQMLSIFDKNDLCKVPFNIEDRFINDTLPFHITLSAWNIEEKNFIAQELNNLKFDKIKTKFKFALMDSSIKGKILYLTPVDNKEIKNLQKLVYNLLPTERYNPNNYTIHSTICIDDNIYKIEEMYNKLKEISLELTIDSICLFEIYPAELITKI